MFPQIFLCKGVFSLTQLWRLVVPPSPLLCLTVHLLRNAGICYTQTVIFACCPFAVVWFPYAFGGKLSICHTCSCRFGNKLLIEHTFPEHLGTTCHVSTHFPMHSGATYQLSIRFPIREPPVKFPYVFLCMRETHPTFSNVFICIRKPHHYFHTSSFAFGNLIRLA